MNEKRYAIIDTEGKGGVAYDFSMMIIDNDFNKIASYTLKGKEIELAPALLRFHGVAILVGYNIKADKTNLQDFNFQGFRWYDAINMVVPFYNSKQYESYCESYNNYTSKGFMSYRQQDIYRSLFNENYNQKHNATNDVEDLYDILYIMKLHYGMEFGSINSLRLKRK